MADEMLVLHVDDNEDFSELVATSLEQEDDRLKVLTATSVEKGLAVLKDQPIECVISDYDMPEQHGIDFLKRVREMDPDLPFILFTAKGSEAVASEAMLAGVSDYLQKGRETEQYALLANRVLIHAEKNRQEAALDEFTQLYHTVVEEGHDGIRIVQDGTVIFVNERLADVLGYVKDDLIGEPAEDIVASEYKDVIHSRHEDRAEGEAVPNQYEVVCETSTGDRREFELSVARIQYRGVPASLSFFRDITSRKARERELQRYETLVNTAGDPVYTLDREGCFTAVNDTFVELTGYDREALLDVHISRVMDPDDVERGEALIQSLLESDRERETFEMDLITASGDRVPCENHIGLLADQTEFRGTVGILRDISERKARERELQEQYDRLNTFAVGVAYDLRDPLNMAAGNLELAIEDVNDRLEEVNAAHGRIDHLLDGLLTFARPDDSVPKSTEVSLATVAQDAWGEIDAPAASLHTQTELTIRADEGLLTQAIEHLFRNAVVHASTDVCVTVGSIEDGFYLEDDGPGIPEAKRAAVLEPGYSTADAMTGLGLSLVNQITQAHGWELHVTDSSNGGTRIEVDGIETGESAIET